MGALPRHCSPKETNNEASSTAGTPSGDPLSTAADDPERRPAVRPDEGRAEARAEGPEVGRADGSGSPRSAKVAGDLGVPHRGPRVRGIRRRTQRITGRITGMRSGGWCLILAVPLNLLQPVWWPHYGPGGSPDGPGPQHCTARNTRNGAIWPKSWF